MTSWKEKPPASLPNEERKSDDDLHLRKSDLWKTELLIQKAYDTEN